MSTDHFGEVVKTLRKEGLYPEIPVVQSAATETKIGVGGKDFLLCSTNNYLGMSSHPKVKEAAINAIEKYGLGSGGPRLLSGNIDVHNKLEEAIGKFVNREDAICFVAGYMTNIGVIPALTNLPNLNPVAHILGFLTGKQTDFKKISIVSDEKNHGSIIDGIKLANTNKLIYKHNDIVDLENKLKELKGERCLIITDGIFSMDGDVAPIPGIVKLAKQYNAMLMVDDAHGIGTWGDTGRGTLEHFGVEDDVDVLMGTFTKAFGGIGGFVAGKKELIDYLRISARTYILSAPLPPAISAGLTKSVEIVAEEQWRREKAWENATYFMGKVKEMGYKMTDTKSLIMPIIIGDEKVAISATKRLYEKGIIAPNARFPAVARGQARLRFVANAQQTKEDLDQLLTALKEIKVELKLV